MARFVSSLWSAGAALLLLAASSAANMAQAVELPHRDSVRVCADPSLMPFSNDRLEGFENKIAEMIGQDLGVPVVYTWWPQTIGFVRNTLRTRQCDLVMGTAAGEELMQNTNPYYRSIYTLVYRANSGPTTGSLADPALHGMRIGVVERTPGATLAMRHGLTNIVPYQLDVDTRTDNPARRAVEDVAAGKTDAAILWGPIAGYYARQQPVALTVTPLMEERGATRVEFAITMGVRTDEPDWKHWLNDFINRRQQDINAVLAEYGVPLLSSSGQLLPQTAAAR